ncbi:response regulator transcription factor [Streptomyces lichenis]|uniref:Response regulator transcription factor n=1 Tax=Streptomyces lichenis TaxID=2306967 RepID=A0ABT0IDV6_9ACTN|nr:response regulator transcription factor [Streptomyces lichenis]MCK8679520.1 response regulator transcription factor [Streptomyces lichenis]
MSVEDGNIRRLTAETEPTLVTPVQRGGFGHSRPRILVASDCPSTEALKQDMRRHGFDAWSAPRGRDVLESYQEYDLLLLDTNLPDLDGVSLCQAIRRESDLPIIGFTAADAEVDRVLLLEAGCDDCVEIPYRARELVARIKAVMRRTGTARRAEPAGQEDDAALEFGPLVIDTPRREARLGGRAISLTRKEFDLLHKLAQEPERIFQRQELMSDVWDYPASHRISAQASRTIDTHVSSLRGKLGNSEWIITIRGVGFRFGVPVPEDDTAVSDTGTTGPTRPAGAGGDPLALRRPRLVRVRNANESGPSGSY